MCVVNYSAAKLGEAFDEPCADILDAVKGTLEKTPPELVADIAASGIIMTGGGALVYGFNHLIERETGIMTFIAEDAISCVAIGTGKSLEHLKYIPEGVLNISRNRQ